MWIYLLSRCLKWFAPLRLLNNIRPRVIEARSAMSIMFCVGSNRRSPGNQYFIYFLSKTAFFTYPPAYSAVHLWKIWSVQKAFYWFVLYFIVPRILQNYQAFHGLSYNENQTERLCVSYIFSSFSFISLYDLVFPQLYDICWLEFLFLGIKQGKSLQVMLASFSPIAIFLMKMIPRYDLIVIFLRRQYIF